MKIYVTRHGETEYSLKNIVCGSTDCPLTGYGREQAQELAEHIKAQNLGIDVIYSSPLIRAKETADIVAAALSVPVVVDVRLREQDCGAFEGNVPRNDEEFNTQRRNFADRLRGGESILQLAQRVYNLLDVFSENRPDKTPLIVGHICVCAMIHSYFNELSNDEYFAYRPGNCELAFYEFN